jgi:hypothetical protein
MKSFKHSDFVLGFTCFEASLIFEADNRLISVLLEVEGLDILLRGDLDGYLLIFFSSSLCFETIFLNCIGVKLFCSCWTGGARIGDFDI